MKKLLCLLVCGLLAASALAQPVAGTREAAIDLVTRDLGGTLDGVRLWIDDAPLSTGQTVAGWHRDIYTAAGDGWLIFVDRHPGANWEHPCWYYYVDRSAAASSVTTP